VPDCRATQANVTLPQHSAPESLAGHRQHASCGCPDAEILETTPSLPGSTATLPTVERVRCCEQPGAADGPSGDPSPERKPAGNRHTRVERKSAPESSPRPIHLTRVPSYDPTAFGADNPTAMSRRARLAWTGWPTASLYDNSCADGEDDSHSTEDQTPTRIMSRTGRVNVANTRTLGGCLVPSQSLEIGWPVLSPSPAGVSRLPALPWREHLIGFLNVQRFCTAGEK